jgi:hypothetical protein
MCEHTAELAVVISAKREFSAYGPSHWAVLTVFAIGSAALVWIGRRQSESQAQLLGRFLGALTAVVYVLGLLYSLLPPTMAGSVPLRLTDLATVTAAYALWSQRHWAFALTYYWGLTLSTQALISPVLYAPDFPSYEFLWFWAIHLLVVWAAIYQHDRGNELRLPQRKTRHPDAAGRTRAMAGVPTDRGHPHRHHLGPDDLAMGAKRTTSQAASLTVHEIFVHHP